MYVLDDTMEGSSCIVFRWMLNMIPTHGQYPVCGLVDSKISLWEDGVKIKERLEVKIASSESNSITYY